MLSTRLIKPLRSVRGFTLVELVVGLGVAGVAGVAVTQLFFAKTQASRASERSAEFSQLVSTLGMSLTHLPTCTEMLASKSFNPAIFVPGSGNKPYIRVSPLQMGGQVLSEGTTTGGLKVLSLGFEGVLQDLGLHASGSHGYMVNLRIVAQPVGAGELSADFTVPLYIDPAANLIQGCSDTAVAGPVGGSCGGNPPLENRCFVDGSGAMDEFATASSCMAYATTTPALDSCSASPTSCTAWAAKLRCCYDLCPGP